MGGKAILLLVAGFSVIFLVLGQNFNRVSNNSATNYSSYYAHNMSHNIAVSGANLAVNQIFLTPSWTTGYSNVSMSGGTMSATVILINPVTNAIRITATGIYYGDTSTVIVNLQQSYFSKFAYCSNSENGVWWANQDTVNGPFHTQDYLNVNGHPVFNPGTNYVGTYKGINKYNSSSSPIINGNLRVGDNLTIPSTGVSTLEALSTSGGHTFTGHDTVFLAFAGDSIRYKYAYNNSWTSAKTSTFAPNGTIVADNAILRIQGTLTGKLTVGASYTSKGGNVYIDDDVVYTTDPRINSSSTDLLGIVAQNNVYVADNPNTANVHIDAAIYAQSGGFGAQNYNTRAKSGYIYLLGGITQNGRLAVGTLDSYGNLSTGFSKNYTYDNRLLVNVPPNFPSTGSYEVISWFE
ncbi:MAG: hypothetical protein P4L45_15590 [Ignavibacteriaceae bacterium]|nr:hypothetical protein [Ignavibacteriaceae bacterium]